MSTLDPMPFTRTVLEADARWLAEHPQAQAFADSPLGKFILEQEAQAQRDYLEGRLSEAGFASILEVSQARAEAFFEQAEALQDALTERGEALADALGDRLQTLREEMDEAMPAATEQAAIHGDPLLVIELAAHVGTGLHEGEGLVIDAVGDAIESELADGADHFFATAADLLEARAAAGADPADIAAARSQLETLQDDWTAGLSEFQEFREWQMQLRQDELAQIDAWSDLAHDMLEGHPEVTPEAFGKAWLQAHPEAAHQTLIVDPQLDTLIAAESDEADC